MTRLTPFGPCRFSGGGVALVLALCLFAISADATVPPVKPTDAPTLKESVASYRGHVVVVNFWATWCDPCMAEFPDLVKLSHVYKSRGLVVIAISGDMPKDVNTKVRPFLVRQHADFPEFILHAEDPEPFINAVDPSWQGEFPHTLIYDKHGRLAKTLSGQQTLASWSQAIRPYLAGKA